jgi:hypothetical protein
MLVHHISHAPNNHVYGTSPLSPCLSPPAARRTLEEFKDEAQHSVEEFK